MNCYRPPPCIGMWLPVSVIVLRLFFFTQNYLLMEMMFIYPKDVMLFTRRSESHAAQLLQQIREKEGKARHLPVTVAEFCKYLKLDIESVIRTLRLRDRGKL